jgi:deoxyribodipyrimidine photo-lyase
MSFDPTPAALQARIAAISPSQYARTRNDLNGAVTGLSPYITHGLTTLPKVLEQLRRQHSLDYSHKLLFEFGWREFFQHVAHHLGDEILSDIRDPVWHGDYARRVPPDVLQACTGVPAIDQAVRTLYATGYLHNHARMWLASYLVHLRKVHWRAGADWMIGYLLDGDLPSNHLSWQWVAGTFASKPYLFNASNVARYAPSSWHSPGTVIDADYPHLEAIATGRESARLGRPLMGDASEPPARYPLPEPSWTDLPRLETLSQALQIDGARAVELVHPWALDVQASPQAEGVVRVAWIEPSFHRQWSWSEQRWRFVAQAMKHSCGALWQGSASAIDVAQDRLSMTETLNPGYRGAHDRVGSLRPSPRFLPQPDRYCASFSKFYEKATGFNAFGPRKHGKRTVPHQS